MHLYLYFNFKINVENLQVNNKDYYVQYKPHLFSLFTLIRFCVILMQESAYGKKTIKKNKSKQNFVKSIL